MPDTENQDPTTPAANQERVSDEELADLLTLYEGRGFTGLALALIELRDRRKSGSVEEAYDDVLKMLRDLQTKWLTHEEEASRDRQHDMAKRWQVRAQCLDGIIDEIQRRRDAAGEKT